MARAHVLDSNGGGASRIAWHFSVPAGNNDAGIAWTVALANSSLRSTSVLPDGSGNGGSISAAEKANLANGSVYEWVDSLEIPPGMTAGQANAYLDEYHAAKQTEVYAMLQRRLRYAGYTRQ